MLRWLCLPVSALVLLAGCIAPASNGSSGTSGADVEPCLAAWDELPSLDPPRTEAAAVAADGRVWVLGGIFDVPGGGTQGRVDVLDPVNGTWSEGPALPMPLHHMGAVAVDDMIVVTGGFVGAPQFVAQLGTWTLSLAEASPKWVAGPPLPAPRGGHVSVTDGTFVYLIGGVTGTAIYLPGGAALLDPSVWRWRAGSDGETWERMDDLPDPRDHLAATYADGKVYAVGGRDLTLNTNTGRLDVLDVGNGTWSAGPAMPTPRGGIGSGLVCGDVCVVGGEAVGATFDETECLDVHGTSWYAAPRMIEPRHGVATATLDGALYVIAGGPQPAYTYSGTVQRLRAA